MAEKSKKNGYVARNIQGLARTESKPSKPIMAWNSLESYDNKGMVVWWSKLDNRYQIEVQRIDKYHANLIIFDHSLKDKMIHKEKVGLSYGATFGPDIADVETWKEISADFIDATYKAD